MAAPRIVREEGGEAALRLPLRPQRLRRVFRGQVAAARPGGRGEMSSDTRARVGLASRRPPIGGGRAAIRQPCSGSDPIFYCMMDLTCVLLIDSQLLKVPSQRTTVILVQRAAGHTHELLLAAVTNSQSQSRRPIRP